MATIRHIPSVLGARAIAFAAIVLAACVGAPLLDRQTRSAIERPPASSIEDAAGRSAAPPVEAEADYPQRGKQHDDDLAHDFGVVPPGSVVRWTYPIENTSDFAWTIDKVHVLCRCTVPSVSAQVIEPGSRESVTLQLDCGDEVADIVKAATVAFKEPNAARVRLLIKASVRAPMTPSPREISFGAMAPGATSEQVVTLANYTPSDWRDVRVESGPEWTKVAVLPLRADAEVRPLGEVSAEPRELWRATVKFSAQELADGYYQSPLVLRADTGDGCEVYVTAHLEPTVRIVPERIVFGPASPGESSVRVARVIFQKGAGVRTISPRVDADNVSVALKRVNDSIWELKATLVVPKDSSVPDGRIVLSFDGGAWPKASLPYSFFAPLGAN